MKEFSTSCYNFHSVDILSSDVCKDVCRHELTNLELPDRAPMIRVGTDFWLKIENFFLENLFRILNDVKRSSDSKYLSIMSVARWEVHRL